MWRHNEWVSGEGKSGANPALSRNRVQGLRPGESDHRTRHRGSTCTVAESGAEPERHDLTTPRRCRGRRRGRLPAATRPIEELSCPLRSTTHRSDRPRTVLLRRARPRGRAAGAPRPGDPGHRRRQSPGRGGEQLARHASSAPTDRSTIPTPRTRRSPGPTNVALSLATTGNEPAALQRALDLRRRQRRRLHRRGHLGSGRTHLVADPAGRRHRRRPQSLRHTGPRPRRRSPGRYGVAEPGLYGVADPYTPVTNQALALLALTAAGATPAGRRRGLAHRPAVHCSGLCGRRLAGLPRPVRWRV